MSTKTIGIGLTKDNIKRLREPFLDEEVQVKPSKKTTDGEWCPMIVYVSHTAVKNRLEEIDPNYTSEVVQAGSGNVYDKFKRETVTSIAVVLLNLS